MPSKRGRNGKCYRRFNTKYFRVGQHPNGHSLRQMFNMLEESTSCGAKEESETIAASRTSQNILSISVVLPTMNEERNVPAICQKLLALKQRCPHVSEAIFVLNNTTDRTEEVLSTFARQHGHGFIKICRSEGARGSAIRRGVEASRSDIVVVMDSDGQYDPQDIPRLVQPILEDGYYVAIGRNHGSENLLRRLISETYKRITKILLGLEYVQTGFKAGIREILLQTVPKDVAGLDIDVRWMNNIAKGYRDRLSDTVNVKLYPRLHGKSAFNPLRLALGLLYTTISLSVERKVGRELPFPQALKRATLYPRLESGDD